MTGYLEWLLDRVPDRRFEIITPRSAGERGCQLSLRVLDRPKETLAAMEASGLVADYRPPDVVRVAPVPLYNTFHEIWQFAQFLREAGRAG